MRRLAFFLVGLGLAVALFVVLRPTGDGDRDTTPPPPPPPAPQHEPSPDPKPRPPSNTAVVVQLSVRGGRPVGGVRTIRVRRSRPVRLIVRSDVSDHVHVHGYDLVRDVGPGGPAVFTFRARLPGAFVIELEERALHLAQLQVR